MGLFQACSAAHGSDASLILECVSNQFETNKQLQNDKMTSWLLLLCAALVFFMQAGFAAFCAGCVRRKNVQNTMLKNLLDACGAAIAFYLVGYGFAFGGNDEPSTKKTFVGTKNFCLSGDIDMGFWFFEYAFSATCTTIVAGTLAERCKMSAYLFYSLVLSGFVYPVVAHAVWSRQGFLSAFANNPLGGVGSIDFSGSGVVHLTGGTTALLATYILGPRRGRFHDNRGRPLDIPKEIKGHSSALQLLGTMILWFGWFGFNPGSALLLTATDATEVVGSRAAVNTALSAAMGAITAMCTRALRTYKLSGEAAFDLTVTMNGTLSGLVAITAACGTVEPYAAIVIGLVAGWNYLWAHQLLIDWRLDDAVDAIPVHLANGFWGLIATGLFSSPGPTKLAFGSDEHVGFFYSLGKMTFDARLLGNQLLAAVFIVTWSTVTMLPFFKMLDYMKLLRADVLDELLGLDASWHDEANGQIKLPEDVTKKELRDAYKESMRVDHHRRYSSDISRDMTDDFPDKMSVDTATFTIRSKRSNNSSGRASSRSEAPPESALPHSPPPMEDV